MYNHFVVIVRLPITRKEVRMNFLEMNPFIFDTVNTFLFAATGICLLATFGLCYFSIDHTLGPEEANRALTWVASHHAVLACFWIATMNAFVWHRPTSIPAAASTLILAIAFICVAKVSIVNGRLDRYIIAPHLEAHRRRSPTPNQEEGPY